MMGAKQPTAAQVDDLIDAMICVMNDMGDDGKCVCELVKAKARVAIEPFLHGDYGDMPDLDKAKALLSEHA